MPQICKKISEALLRVQKAGQRKRSTLKGIASHRRAIFVDRIREKLEDVFKDEPDLQVVLRNSGTVMGETCAPINDILQKAERFLEATRTTVTPVLQHGDPHLGNIMIRRYRFGHGIKLLDPNPLIGFHDPLYDVGKLFHWAEEVGWAAIRPKLCVGKLVRRGSHWQLTSNNVRTSPSDRLRRKLVEIVDTQIFDQLVPESDGTARDRLPLAIASAHIGLTTPLTGADKRDVRRFVLAHALRHLALWNKAN